MKLTQCYRSILLVLSCALGVLALPAKGANADLGVSISAAPDPVNSGANLTYTLTVTNNGPDAATDVFLTNILSSGQRLADGGGAPPCPTGLAAFWKGEDNTDDSMGGGSGTLHNGATYANGKVGRTFSLDGIDDYITFPDSPAVRPAQFTVEGWFYPNTSSGIEVLVGKRLGTSFHNSFALLLFDGVPWALISDGTGLPIIQASSALSAGTWHHLAMTFDGVTLKIYADNTEVASGTPGIMPAYDSNPIMIGADIDSVDPDFFFDGLADEVSLYNRALNATEIGDIYSADVYGKCSTIFRLGTIASETATTLTLTTVPTLCSGTVSDTATVSTSATDSNSGNDSAVASVTVQDGIVPVITCVSDKNVECGSAWDFDAPSATDNCGVPTVVIVSTVTNTSGFCGNTFEATRKWSATDAAGNTNACTQKVTVVDTTNPSITCVGDKSVECGTPWTFDDPTSASDACGSVMVSDSTMTNATCGTTFTATRTWTATDACGHTAQCSQIVSVVDTTPPTISCAADKTVACDAVWSFDAPTVGDTCGGAVAVIVSTVTNPPSGGSFTAVRTWKAADACNNMSANCSQTVTVTDTTVPTITCVANKNAECGTPWTFDAPSAADNCGTPTIAIVSTVTNTSGFCGNTFEATRKWSATDAAGNTNACTQKVTVVDTTNPTITCVANKNVECGTAWTFDAPSASDTCGTTTISIVSTVTNTTGFCGNTFEATRTWKATDACGHDSSTCSQKVTIVDTTNPTISCLANKNVECGSAWTFDAPSGSDTCGSTTISIVSTVTNTTGFCGNTFEATRTWKATDACGHDSSTCSQKVTIVDTTAPTITCAANKMVSCDAAWTFDAPTVGDTCGTATPSIVSTVTNPPSGGTFTVVRTWKAIDACNNMSGNCSQTVTVTDSTVPTITCVANKNVECGTAWTFDAPTAADNCSTPTVVIVSTVTNAVGFCGNTFEATRKWSATDSAGNTNACTQKVTVVDTTIPTITCVANKNVECGSAWTFDAPSASDTCGSTTISIVSTVTNTTGFCGNTFEATRTWKATDACGHDSATCSQKVTIVDTTNPTITCVADKNVECGSAWTFDAPSGSDTCGNTTISIVSTVTNTTGFCGNTFEATRTWKATDACGHDSATCSQKVTVIDTTNPTITCAANKSVACETAWTFDAPTAADTCGTATASIVSTVTNAPSAGSYTVVRTWSATDACGHQSTTCSQTVTVTDSTPPTITCQANKTVECGASTFDTPIASDNCGAATVTIVSSTTNTAGFCGGTYQATRTWKATDPAGNMAQCSQTVTVVDTTAPVLVCVANKSVQCGSVWDFDSPAVSDACGSFTLEVLSTVVLGSGSSGFTVTRTWKATDACTNSTQCSQTVMVVDTTAPTITCSANKTVPCGTAWTFDTPTAADTCSSATVSIVSTVTNTVGFCGNTFEALRNWSAVDDSGNMAQCSQRVTVVDTTAPDLLCVANKSVECNTPFSFDEPTATDACGSATVAIVSTVTNGLCGNTFAATRTWRATDSCNNMSATCSQTVTVVDTGAPTITCAPDRVEPCTGVAWTFDNPAASDECGSVTITVVSTVTNAIPTGGYTATRTWKAMDSCGNMAQCSQNISVYDGTPELSIELDMFAGTVKICWPITCLNNQLEFTPVLEGTLTWLPVAEPATVMGSYYCVTTHIGGDRRVFRLRQEP